MILDVASRRADLTPDRDALHWAGRWHTYGELNERATRAAAYLAALGVRKGDRVAIAAHNHIAHFDLLLATAKLGFIYTPLNVRLASHELRGLGAYLRPNVVLHDDEHGAAAAASAAGASETATASARTIDLGAWEEQVAAGPLALPEVTPPTLGPEDTQMILLTGGTTGLPKGAMLPYRQVFYNAVNTVLSWGLNEDDVAVQATPCYHAAINVLATPLFQLGGRTVLQSKFDAGYYLRSTEELGVTILFLVPTMYAMLASHPSFEERDLSRVRWAISGGAACPEPVRRAFAERGVRFRQGYGLTEAGVNCFSITLDQAEARPESVGKPLLHAEAAVRRPDGAECAAGEVGELTLMGPHVFSGYFERPEATAEVLRDGWLWTGDLASTDAGGFFTIRGRRKEMFISGGENVFPAEVEAAIYDHPSVAECAVLGVADDRWGEVGLAVVVLRNGAQLAPDELRAHLAERLARYKLPKHLEFAAELPKSGAGKILKTALRERFEAQAAPRAAEPAAGSPDGHVNGAAPKGEP